MESKTGHSDSWLTLPRHEHCRTSRKSDRRGQNQPRQRFRRGERNTFLSHVGDNTHHFDGSGDKGKIWLSQFEIGNYEYMIISNVQYDESYNDDAYVREDDSHADKLYYPMFGGSYDGTRIRSLAGQTLMYNTNASTEITRAKANGNGWNIGSWSKRNLLDCMLKIMSKTDNSQTAFGRGQTSGYVNDASQNYGHLATGTLTNKGQFFGYKDTTHEVKVFYIEKWWGNRWDRINGLLMVGGEILAKMTPPYNLTGKDFEKVGITFTSSGNGYQKGTKSSRFGRIVNSMKSVVEENTSGIVESVTQFQKDAVIDEYTQQLIEEGLI